MITAHILDASDAVVNSIVLVDNADPAAFGAMLGPENVGIGWSFDGTNWAPPVAPPTSLDDRRAAKISEIVAVSATLLISGAPVASGLHVALDDRSLSDLLVMSGIATAAASGAISWPGNYARGWITIENIRLPLHTPADGLALAATVGNHYAAIVQHRRDLKDAALAAEDTAALEAIEVAAGWPI